MKLLNLLLLVTFAVTNLVPLTGVHIHKMASMLFLLLCLIHTVVCRKKLNRKKYALLGIVILAFVSGLLGMIFDQYPLILALHKVISIASVFTLAVHIFVYHKRLK